MHFKFQPAPRSGKVVVKAENVRKSYGNNLVLNKVDLEIERETGMAFVDRNWSGKIYLGKSIIERNKRRRNPDPWSQYSFRVLRSRSSRRIRR